MKKCSCCNKTKDSSCFNKHKKSRDGLNWKCKDCEKIYKHKYYLANKKVLKQYQVDYEVRNRKKVKVRRAMYYLRNKKHIREMSKEYYFKHKAMAAEYSRNCHLRQRYGMTWLDKIAMLASQDGYCCICKTKISMEQACVDHDHKTNKVRGLLCNYCNHLLGHAKDNVNIWTSAIKYLGGNNR